MKWNFFLSGSIGKYLGFKWTENKTRKSKSLQRKAGVVCAWWYSRSFPINNVRPKEIRTIFSVLVAWHPGVYLPMSETTESLLRHCGHRPTSTKSRPRLVPYLLFTVRRSHSYVYCLHAVSDDFYFYFLCGTCMSLFLSDSFWFFYFQSTWFWIMKY